MLEGKKSPGRGKMFLFWGETSTSTGAAATGAGATGAAATGAGAPIKGICGPENPAAPNLSVREILGAGGGDFPRGQARRRPPLLGSLRGLILLEEVVVESAIANLVL